MNANSRTNRRTIAARSAATRSTRRAVKAVATGAPQPAKTHMIAAGIDAATAKRFAGAFSNRVSATATGETTIKLKGRRTKLVPVKLYDRATFTARLSVYRPKNLTAAGIFARAAHRLAA
jgi:hypothetical protein